MAHICARSFRHIAALRFQPTKRPQVTQKQQKAGHKIPQAKPVPPPPSRPIDQQLPPEPASTQRAAPKTTIADWTGDGDDDDVNGFYGEKRQRGGRKKRKKNKEDAQVQQNWDDIYDPSRPNSYEEYRHSDEQLREVREWKDRLYAYRIAARSDSYSDSDDESDQRPQMNSMLSFFMTSSELMYETGRFAPPMSFGPPPEIDDPSPPPPPPPADIPDDATGEDAYARRLRLSQQHGMPPQPPPPPPSPPSTNQLPATISRAPVRYNLPPPPEDIPKSEAELESALREEEAEESEEVSEDAPRSLRPGQKGFAARLMSKYGWTKGTGLGANNSGIINPLRVQVDKQKMKPDSEGGGFVGPGGRGKIIGGKKNPNSDADGGKFGPMSDVVVLRGMIDGLDLEQELDEGNLMQEIGEECSDKVRLSLLFEESHYLRGTKYGRVERVYIDRGKPASPPVYIKFTSQLSALRVRAN